MELRDYQVKASNDAFDIMLAGGRPLIVLPTGAGKTEVAIDIARRVREHDASPHVVVVVPTRTLVYQTAGRFTNAGMLAGTDWKARQPQPGGVLVVTAAKYRNRARAGLHNPDCLAILDEAHHFAAWLDKENQQLVDLKQTAVWRQHRGRLFGLSATPWRLDDCDSMDGRPCDTLVLGPEVRELIDAGHLCDYRQGAVLERGLIARTYMDAQSAKRMRSNKDARDFGSDMAIAGMFTNAPERVKFNWTHGAVEIWEREAAGRPTVAFALGREHAYVVQGAFAARGWAAEVIVDGTPVEERQDMAARLATGETHALISVNCLKEGFDAPAAEVVLGLRPTASLSLWRQMLGRGMRPKPNGSDCLILDLTDNAPYFMETGLAYLPDTPVDWSLGARDQRPPGDPPEKHCPECGAICAAAARVCPKCQQPFGTICDRCGVYQPWGCITLSDDDRSLCTGCENSERALRSKEDAARLSQEIENQFRLRQEREKQLATAGREFPIPWLQPTKNGNGMRYQFANGGVWFKPSAHQLMAQPDKNLQHHGAAGALANWIKRHIGASGGNWEDPIDGIRLAWEQGGGWDGVSAPMKLWQEMASGRVCPACGVHRCSGDFSRCLRCNLRRNGAIAA